MRKVAGVLRAGLAAALAVLVVVETFRGALATGRQKYAPDDPSRPSAASSGPRLAIEPAHSAKWMTLRHHHDKAPAVLAILVAAGAGVLVSILLKGVPWASPAQVSAVPAPAAVASAGCRVDRDDGAVSPARTASGGALGRGDACSTQRPARSRRTTARSAHSLKARSRAPSGGWPQAVENLGGLTELACLFEAGARPLPVGNEKQVVASAQEVRRSLSAHRDNDSMASLSPCRPKRVDRTGWGP